MNPNDVSVLSYPVIVARQWWSTVTSSAEWYSAVLDPRPDLSIPAHTLRLPYAWWW